METKQPEIRLALLSTDHEDMEGYEKALRTLFEENVISIGHFNWGVTHPNPPVIIDRDDRMEFGGGRDKNATTLHLRVPESMASAVSIFQEQLTNTTLRRDHFDQDRNKSFTLALYELVDGAEFSIGRIKVISNCFFPEVGIGYGQMQEPRAGLEHGVSQDQPEQWKIKPVKRPTPEVSNERSIHFVVGGRELIANDKARQAVYDHAYADFSMVPEKKVKK